MIIVGQTSGNSGSGARAAGGLRLNYLTAQLSSDRIDCTQVPFRSREDLQALRERTADTHEVFRHGKVIRLVELIDGVPQIGDPVTLDIPGEGSSVAARLLQEALKRVVTEHWQYLLRKSYPPTFVSRETGRDLLEDVHGQLPATKAFHVYPEYRLDGRQLSATGDVGVVVGLKSRYEMDLTTADLLRLGMDLTGRHVMTAAGVEPFPHQDSRYARRLLGRIRQVDGDHLLVEVGNNQLERHPTEKLWLETRKDNFDQALSLVANRDTRSVLDRLQTKLYELTGGPGRLTTTRRIADGLGRRGPLPLACNLLAKVGPVLGDDPQQPYLRFRTLNEPTYAFDMTGDKSARYAEHGLKEHGPFDREHFTPKTPHLIVITPSHYQGAVEQFVSSFRDGVPNSSSFADGFVRRFGLSGLQLSLVTFEGSEMDASAYRKASKRALEEHPKASMAIVIISKKQQHLVGNDSPYLVTKSVFMSQSIPVQEFQIENIRGRDFTEILRNVSLACYAKLGGTPYLIRAPYRPMARELVIGLGSAYRTTERMAETERSVGITTVFDAMGNYVVSNTSREADYDDYPTALQEALVECIEDVMGRNYWQPQDTIRLVFHVFKPLRDREAVAVKRLVEGLAGDFAAVEFAFLHVSDAHDWMLFDPANKGLPRRGGHKGVGIPRRGLAVRLSRRELLVTVHGPGDLKTTTQGAPRPLLLKLHRESTFDDLDYLAEQLFRFTAMSWRRPFPASEPVTILYSELMARLLGQLRGVRNWNSDMISTRLATSRWFL